jgi:hypothetical protein
LGRSSFLDGRGLSTVFGALCFSFSLTSSTRGGLPLPLLAPGAGGFGFFGSGGFLTSTGASSSFSSYSDSES